MKIAMIGQKGFPMAGGGVETHVDNLARNLAKNDQEVLIYCRSDYSKQVKGNSLRNIKQIFVPTIPTKHFATALHSLLASIHVLFTPVDIVHYHGIGPSLFLWIPKVFKPSVKIVSTIHSRDYMHGKWGGFSRFMLKTGERTASSMSDEIIAVSKENKAHIKSRYSRSSTYIPNGVNIPISNSNSESVGTFTPSSERYILSVGRLIPHKGVHTLIEAFKSLDTDIKLVIVGDSSHTSDYVQQLKDLSRSNSNILFTGAQTGKKLDSLYSNALIFVQPSSAEGLSIALLEAMSYKLPVITSNIKANTDVVGKGDHVFLTHSVQSLAKKLFEHTTLKTKRAKLASQQHKIVKSYLWKNICAQTLSVYGATYRKPESRSTRNRSTPRVLNT